MEREWGNGERERGNGERMRKCRESISLHFLFISSFSLHFLILSPFPRSPAARLQRVVTPCTLSRINFTKALLDKFLVLVQTRGVSGCQEKNTQEGLAGSQKQRVWMQHKWLLPCGDGRGRRFVCKPQHMGQEGVEFWWSEYRFQDVDIYVKHEGGWRLDVWGMCGPWGWELVFAGCFVFCRLSASSSLLACSKLPFLPFPPKRPNPTSAPALPLTESSVSQLLQTRK